MVPPLQYLDNERIGHLFEQKGMRWTMQRRLILQIIRERVGHLTVDEIYQEIGQTFPEVNRTTIYRTLETLRDLGVVVQVNNQGETRRYEMVLVAPHYHALCEKCGVEVELDKTLVEKIQTDVHSRYGLQLQLEHFLGMVICKHCQPVDVSSHIIPN